MSQEQQKGNPVAKRPRGRPKKNSSDKNEKRNQEIEVIQEGDDMIFDRIGKKKEQPQEPIRATVQDLSVGGRAFEMPGIQRPIPPSTEMQSSQAPVSAPIPPTPQPQQQPPPKVEELHPYHKEFIEKYQGSFTPMEFPHTAVSLDLQWATYSVLCDCRWLLNLMVEEVRKR